MKLIAASSMDKQCSTEIEASISFLFFRLLPVPPLPYRKVFYSEIFYCSVSVKGNIQSSQNQVPGAAMENTSNRVPQRPTG